MTMRRHPLSFVSFRTSSLSAWMAMPTGNIPDGVSDRVK